MLVRLSIRNYALIDNLDIAFSPALNILTGETGAGKSIILGALSLILGQRTDSRYFFNQQKKCIIEGYFAIGNYAIGNFFSDNDLDYEDETVLRREISADGRSRAFINDTPVNLSILKRLGEQLIDIHSQHATLEINDEAFQLLVVDTLAGHHILLDRYRETYRAYKKLLSRLNDLLSASEKSKSELDYLQFQFDELEHAGLSNTEQETLETELNTLTHAEEIKRALSGATHLLDEHEHAALRGVKESITLLQQASRFLPEAGALLERLNSTHIELKDILAEIVLLDEGILLNEARSEEISDRLAILYGLQKKHRVNTVTELIDMRDELSAKLNQILFSDDEIENLKAETEKLKAEMSVLADNLSASRNEIVPVIEAKLAELLTQVGMPNAVVQIGVSLLKDGEYNADGRNHVRFMFSANKGQEPAPMDKVASGGELSRLMLCIKSLISRHTALPTIIFDEIDTGISGETALKVGTIMEKLSEGMQVITITHLPQIASKGQAHYRVFKDEQGERTLTNITRLNESERVTEIAIMLSGADPGEFALNNARELLKPR